ncbi:MAG TPA: universal stress protein [Gemmatimonadaceae bacterium]|nr:universal stress protein [Gemmatimonadaceae bacterium]
MDGAVVIGVDFSPVMLRAVPWVREHIMPGAHFVAAHVTERRGVPGFLRDLVAPDADAGSAARAAAEERLKGWCETIGIPHAEVVVREGRADHVLRQVAFDVRARLLVIGAHGGRERPWMRLGTTTERLLRGAETSMLIVRGPMAGPPRRILVAVDDVEITPQVLAVAGAFADRFDARLHGVHVLSEASYSHLLSAEAAESRDPREERAKLEKDLAEESLRWLRALWENTRRHSHLEVEIPHGVPGDEILRLAREYGADLVVIGRYGIGRVIPAVLGSVVGSVVAGAECPVLVVTS